MKLWDLSFQELKLRPGRTLLTMLSIVIGVTALVAVGMAVNTARSTFDRMVQSLAGAADLRIEARSGGRFAQTVLDKIEKLPGVEEVVPFLRQNGQMYTDKPGGANEKTKKIRLLLFGVVPANYSRLHDYEIVKGHWFENDDEVLLENGLARGISVEVGDTVTFLTGGGLKKMKVVGLLAPAAGAALTDASVAFWPLATLQDTYPRARGKVSAALVIVKKGADVEQVRSQIRQVLPEEINVVLADKQSGQTQSTRVIVETGLALAALVSVLAMVFVILNTFLMTLSERRRNLAILRVLGAARGQIWWLLLREGLVLAIVGSLIGLMIGYSIAVLIVRGMEIGFQVTLPAPQLTPLWVFLAVAQGVGLVVVSVLYPAHRATTITPREGLRRDLATPADKGFGRWPALVGVALVLAALVLFRYQSMTRLPLQVTVIGPVLLLLAAVFLFPLIMTHGVQFVGAGVQLLWPVPGQLAQEQLLRHRTRTYLTWAILFVAIVGAYALGDVLMEAMSDVHTWCNQTARCDFILRAAMPGEQADETPAMPLELKERITGIRGITRVIAVRFVTVSAGDKRLVAIARQFPPDADLPLVIHEKIPSAEVREQLLQGGIVMGAIAAQQLGVGPGDEIEIELSEKKHTFAIIATCSVYAMGGFAFYLDYQVAQKVFDIEGADVFVIDADTKVNDHLEAELRVIADKEGAILQSFQDFSTTVDTMLAAVTASLWALLALGFVVALFGNVNTLTMNVLEQTQEIGLLRVVGMTGVQIRQFVMCQALAYALLALVPGLLGGCLLAYLVRRTSQGMFGQDSQVAPNSLMLALVFVVVFLLIIAVAWFPARRAVRVPMLAAIVRE